MSIEDFIRLCDSRGLHFTANWTRRTLARLKKEGYGV